MKALKYKKIASLEQYNTYCNIHEKLVMDDYDANIDEIELLEVLIENYDNRVMEQTYVALNPVELLHSLLEEHQLGQSEFAKKIGISRQLINDILNYRRNISKEVVTKIAAFFAMNEKAFSRTYEVKKTSTSTKETEKDDLQLINGIGPKVEDVLNQANIMTFNDLMKIQPSKIVRILKNANPSYVRHYNAATWQRESKQYLSGKQQRG